ncbi:isocitrate dehydrogenase (NAD+) [Tieghemostelium lacteum]|uniref:Isocitrate dehydrogenase (NAD+) n=1 Tax=Tieghemostelium lacteum TaxID=361077 RepID=L7VSK8_TIELA|nr:NAD+ isocitrate dehydrogenase [Tieghemostelium lacteum]KYR03134.1 isocitrate dehydrogenase (NAD+) [Tieghemostelium lacteum]|eukprot:KYR03134.1 isocitrate dehydrogenase (NAD+) [Tieghemostelium lacteum]
MISQITRSLLKLKVNTPQQQYVRNYLGYTSGSKSDKKKVTIIPGDGIGPEITSSVMGVFQAAKVPIEWELFDGKTISQDLIASISRNKVALKGPLYTELLTGAQSRNMEIRKALDLYAHVIPCKQMPGIQTRHSNTTVDFVVIRENTQGEYSGLEQTLVPGVVQSLKIVTKEASARIARYAFEYAKAHGRKKVTAIHKANIQKQTDGLFLETCKQVAKEYPEIAFDSMIIDNCCMQLVMNPQQFDVMVTPNLYGNLVTNVGAALIGGPGLAPGANVGERAAIFEMGAHHVAADIAGMDKANPTGLLLASSMMLRHLNLDAFADKVENAVKKTIDSGKFKTQDLGGTTSTKEFTRAIISEIESQQ